MRSWNQTVGLVEIAAKLFRGARLAGIVASGHDAAAKAAFGILKAAHIIALPAVQADSDRAESSHGRPHIDVKSGVTFAGDAKGRVNLSVTGFECHRAFLYRAPAACRQACM